MSATISVLAVVPARSGSQGIAHKNMSIVGGMSLIARAGEVLRDCSSIDRAIISTDSPTYQQEGAAHGLDAWFLRPRELSTSSATAVDTMVHALEMAESHYGRRFEIVLIVEPTSPLREPADVEACIALMISSGADAVVTVSRVESKFHPDKLLSVESGRLRFMNPAGAEVTARQQLRQGLYFRNGVCYALRRDPLLAGLCLFPDHTLPYVIDRPLVNIDEPFELELAEFLLARSARQGRGANDSAARRS